MDSDTSESKRIELIHSLELEHQSYLYQTRIIHQDEHIRTIKLQSLLSRDDTAALLDKLGEKNTAQHQLSNRHSHIRRDLKEARTKINTQATTIRTQSAHIIDLEARIRSLDGSEQAKADLVQDKLLLTTELNRLRQELEHHKASLTDHQVVVSTKQNLQRQVDSLEVELENERRAQRRTQARDEGTLDELRNRAQAAEERLAAQQQEQEKVRRRHDKLLSEAHGQRDRLEERVATMRMKTKEALVHLDTTKHELAQCQAELELVKGAIPKTKVAAEPIARKARKRIVDDPSFAEITIQTPGDGYDAIHRPAKKRGVEQSVLGEKSAFSVTPYLNRNGESSSEFKGGRATVGIAAEISEQSKATDEGPDGPRLDGDASSLADSNIPEKPNSTVDSHSRKPRGRPKKAVAAAQVSDRNDAHHLAPPVEPAPHESSLSEGQMKDKPLSKARTAVVAKPQPPEKPSNVPQISANPGVSFADGAGVTKKKRKLLGTGKGGTLLDEDNVDEDQQPPPQPKRQLNAARLRAPLGKGPATAFGSTSFSPLKKHRRGANASFLV